MDLSECQKQEQRHSSEPDRPKETNKGSHTTPINNNNHHVVPVGVLIVLFTLYLTTAALHRHYDCDASHPDTRNLVTKQVSTTSEAENKRHAVILDKFLDYKEVCIDLEIFTKKPNVHSTDEKEIETIPGMQYTDAYAENNVNSGRSSKNISSYLKKAEALKVLTGKSGNGRRHNKSTKFKLAKKQEANKKDEQSKKNSTAEPIIYLFALVFIYLLLKAASDINQHYKSQAKSEKRLRRCSLQSYAQAHKQDRRASKVPASKYLPKLQ